MNISLVVLIFDCILIFAAVGDPCSDQVVTTLDIIIKSVNILWKYMKYL